MNPFYKTVAAKARYRCEYCHAPQDAVNFAFDVEDILPLTAGGTDDNENLALACRSCNAFKRMQQGAQDPKTGETVRLFHPRNDGWTDHFSISTDETEIIGTTPIGRATIVALKMNSPLQKLARTQWKRLDLFP